MKKLALVILISTMMLGLQAQDRVTMASPVVRSTPDEISVVARFTDFAGGGEYRIGVGAAGAVPSSVKIELSKDESPVGVNLSDFEQGYTGSWWGVEKIQAKGFELSGPTVPVGSEVVLRFTVSRADAEATGKLFLFSSKKYGENIWYVEAGIELNKDTW